MELRNWLTDAEAVVGPISDNAEDAWTEMIANVNEAYEAYLKAKPVERLKITPKL